MAALKARVVSQGRGITNTGQWTVILAAFSTSINYIIRGARVVAHGLVGQGFNLNQAQLCVMPVPSQAISRTTRRRMS